MLMQLRSLDKDKPFHDADRCVRDFLETFVVSIVGNVSSSEENSFDDSRRGAGVLILSSIPTLFGVHRGRDGLVAQDHGHVSLEGCC